MFYNKTIEEVLEELKTSSGGLNNKEVEERIKKYGKNKLKETKKQSKISKFLSEFTDLMIIILLLSAVVSLIISIINNEPFTDSIIIVGIVIMNAVLGFIQELKADKAIDSLKKMQVTKVKVKRNNNTCIIDSEDIVVGDILVLEAGDTVPADARIIWEASLKVDEASLTGESIPVPKTTDSLNNNIPLSEKKNMIYSGTSVVYGKCIAVTCSTGMNTEIGKICDSLSQEKKEITPLQKKINGISKVLSLIIATIIVIMFIVGLIKGMDLVEIIMLSISLAVAAIPEGLPAIITITLSLGMSAMAKKRAIVRKMSSVETLGCTEVICSDKTGTITKNRMKVREVYFNDNLYDDNLEILDNMLLNAITLNNDVTKNQNNYIGDPTEVALYEFSEKYTDVMNKKETYPRIDEIPFDSDRKMMSTINKIDNKNIIFTKGSFDSIIDRCSYIYKDGKITILNEKEKENLKQVEINESKKAYRILAYAYQELNEDYVLSNELENNLIFIGITCMIDPPRDDVKEAITLCKEAHIRPIMITGDSVTTATAIAKEIGIIESDEGSITGVELDKYNEEELKDIVTKYSVYARVSPINKLSIVKALQENNKIVAMTGDGVNDAPALKKADIGVGMGITGTDVSKGVSDIILADDSFSTIVTAVKEGRRIFDNIRNVLVYLLTGNACEVLVVFIGMIFGLEIFLPIQILYINLITDSIPAIALAFEKAENDIMKRNVRRKDSSFFTPFLISRICFTSILKTVSILAIYFVNKNSYGIETASTMAFFTLVLLEMAFAYSCRNLKNNMIGKNLFSNSYMNKSIIILILIQGLVFFTPIGNIFEITGLNFIQIINCFVVVIIIILINELSKKFINKTFDD